MSHSIAHRSLVTRTRPALFASVGLAAALAAAGCSSSMNGAQASAQGQPIEATDAPGDEARAGGPLARLDAKLAGLELDASRRATVDAIRADLRAARAPVKQVAAELAEAVAAGVEAGALDRAAVDRDVERLAKAAEAATPAFQAALDRLHATLDPAQRKALVASLRPKWGEHFRGGGERGAEHAGEHARGEHPRGEHAFGAHGARGHFGELVKDLDLRPEQTEALRAKARESFRGREQGGSRLDLRGGFAHMRAIAEAFESDRFDAKALGVGQEAPAMVRGFAERATAFAESAAPVLTADQRAKLATKIRERAASWE